MKTMGCGHKSAIGTVHAIYHVDIEFAAPSPIAPHGGPRNRASRTSHGIPLAMAVSLLEAAEDAARLGLPFNRHITVHWELAGIADNQAMAATTAFLKYWRDWLGGQTAYVWVRENGDGKGSHLHILAHLPAGKKWRGALSRRWIERITGKPYAAGVILSRRIAGAGDNASPHYAANLQAVRAYVLKGATPDAAGKLGIAHAPGGRIIGKRCGTSRNIGKAARARRQS